ncbi:putative Mcsc-pending-prov protein [Basidiobolus meristosporus CBS 931.73]|uniref:Putative Mcsc-pending-prov protein n=1 Tax=Basidiobolus meristosporus CBS 931.73 TaxID=1314790 RepID=A0A1Y1YRY6_9FUNG|nr:putative Mcsc-pending-prov protein [Basidiobolus meristosporus CBS 931.73]|eukprot:ORY00792.1 putative Mcsc-pending-prov protein [Basidiobolus meristosporus CBS 931.73]
MATTIPKHTPSSSLKPILISEHRSTAASSPYQETPLQREDRLQKSFRQFDLDKKGYLVVTDIERGTTRPLLGKEHASKILELLDENKDGVVDYLDFRSFLNTREAQLWKLFCELSNSTSRSLLPSQLHERLRSIGIELGQEELKEFVSFVDSKADGVIDFDEWKDFLLFAPHVKTLSHVYDHFVEAAQLTTDEEVEVLQPSMVLFLLAGAIAGAVSRTITAPLDRLKVYMQTQTHGGKKYGLSLNGAIRELYSAGGISNFFRGNGLNVVKIAPESAVKFYAYEHCKLLVRRAWGLEDGEDLSMAGRFLAGGFAGLASQTSIYPLEILKTRMMSSSGVVNNSHQSSIMLPTAKAMWRQEGMRAFFKGLLPSLVGVFPFAAIDLSVFESLKYSYIGYYTKNGGSCQEPSVLALLGCGMISGTVGATIVYPLSLIRTRLQAQGTPGHPHTYTGAFDVIRTTYRRETIRGFYKGIIPTLTKVVPAVSISYVVYEACKQNLGLVGS